MTDRMHYFGAFDERALVVHPVYERHSHGYRVAELINRAAGSMHTGLSMNELVAGGSIDPHVHSFEEGFYLLEGEVVVTIAGTSYRLGPGDFAAVKVGTEHAWTAVGPLRARWLQMAAPQPKPVGAERDTFFPRNGTAPGDAPPLDLHNLQGNLLGHFDEGQIPPVGQRTNVGPGLEGVFLKWLIDENLGSCHHRLLFIEYQPGVRLGLHDHTFEEAYFILKGEVEATVDGRTYLAKPGDVVWTGVGCVHGFANVGTVPVTWLETFAPQPPKENVFRFMAEWEAKAKALEG
jgi:quercetin dioxygenase-like cupin family protein